MRKFFKTIILINIFDIILTIIFFNLYINNFLTKKEFIVILGGILGVTFICYLFLFYENSINHFKGKLKQKDQLVNDLTQSISNIILITNYLTDMCNKSYLIMEDVGWKRQWENFLNPIKKEKNINNLKNIGKVTTTNNYSESSNKIISLDDLKKSLKFFEIEENYEQCQKILKQIKEMKK